jgi:hypothetical protein
MKRLILASLLLATPAMAQEPSPEQFVGSLQVQVSDALTQIKSAMIMRDRQIAALQQQAAAKDKQIADLTAENAKLKAPAPAEPAK